MSKYIVEIEEKPLCVFDKDTQTYFPRLWRVKGFNSLVFDKEGLSRLEELNSDYINEHYGSLQDEAYQRGYKDCQTRYCSFDACPNRQAEYKRGLEDAWECARELYLNGACKDLFGEYFSTFIKYHTAQEAIEKLKAYEAEQGHSDTIDESYTIGYKQANNNSKSNTECDGCLYDYGIKEHSLCHTCSNAYINHWTAKKQDDKIEVGDEVNWLGDCFIVTRIFQPHNMKEQCDGIDDDGCVYHDVLMDDLEKTGRHFDIEKILEEMRE